jgi:carboxypeptidase family protein
VAAVRTFFAHRTRRGSGAVIGTAATFLILTGIGGVVGPESTASASTLASISGTVVSDTSTPAPLAGICVAAIDDGDALAAATTNKSGDYKITKLDAGTYKVEFTDCKNTLYLAQFYDDETIAGNDGIEATGNSFTVSAGESVTGINASLEEGGKFVGAVTTTPPKHQKAVGISGICVEAAPVFDTNDPDYNPPYEYATTNVSGHYTISGLWNWGYEVTYNECGLINPSYGGASAFGDPLNAYIGVSFHLASAKLPAA